MMQDILNTNPDNPPLSDSELRFVIEKQLQLLNLATETHVKLVRRFFNNLGWDNSQLIRNYQLARLNRNLRIFNTRIRRLLVSRVAGTGAEAIIEETRRQIDKNGRDLEAARLFIFNPEEPRTLEADDSMEFAELGIIRVLYHQCHRGWFQERANRLYDTPGISVSTLGSSLFSFNFQRPIFCSLYFVSA
jgi:hypothetical protein